MRILQATGAFLPVKGGCPYFVHHLTQHLEAMGEDCKVVTTGRGRSTTVETVPTARARSVGVAGFPIAPTYPVVLWNAIQEFDPDVIHAHYPLPLYPEKAAVVSALRDVPVVLTCHGALEMTWDSIIGVFGSIYNRTLLQGSLAAADRLHVSNDGILEELSLFDRYAEKVSTVPMGVDTEWYDPDAVSGPPPYDGERDTILFVGTFRRYKGLDDLVAAFDRVIEDHDCQLVFVGDGPRRKHVQSAVQARGLTADVSVLGHLGDEALRRAYASADIFALPSPSIDESFGLVALEAMAMGVPTVVTAGSGIGHVLADTAAGTVVPPADPDQLAAACSDLLTDQQRARKQSAAGRRLVANRFAWSALVDDYQSLYHEIA